MLSTKRKLTLQQKNFCLQAAALFNLRFENKRIQKGKNARSQAYPLKNGRKLIRLLIQKLS